jgi:hypothetical protein
MGSGHQFPRNPPDTLSLFQYLVSQYVHLIHLQHPSSSGFLPEVYGQGWLIFRAVNGSVL